MIGVEFGSSDATRRIRIHTKQTTELREASVLGVGVVISLLSVVSCERSLQFRSSGRDGTKTGADCPAIQTKKRQYQHETQNQPKTPHAMRVAAINCESGRARQFGLVLSGSGGLVGATNTLRSRMHAHGRFSVERQHNSRRLVRTHRRTKTLRSTSLHDLSSRGYHCVIVSSGSH